MEFVYNIYDSMKAEKLILAYEGEFTRDISNAVLAMAEKNLENSEKVISIKKKVFNVMVECIQNIVKHAEEKTHFGEGAIFLVGKENDHYMVCSGNFINNTDIVSLEKKLNEINDLDKEGLKQKFKETLNEGTLNDKGGAGLGFIDMVRKSGEKLEYSFKQISEKQSFFSLKSKISRVKKEQ